MRTRRDAREPDDISFFPSEDVSIPEEDSDDFTDITYNHKSVKDKAELSCTNRNLYTLEEYTKDDNPIEIFTLDSNSNFTISTCITRDEFKEYLLSGRDTTTPPMIKCLYTTPLGHNVSGMGSYPTGKLVVMMPPNNIHITYGSIQRMMKEKNVNKWYAVQLYGSQRRRIGNLAEIFGVGLDHGQLPGYHVYKLFTKEELKLKLNTSVTERSSDYPHTFIVNNIGPLYGVVSKAFVNNVIDALIK